MSTFLNAVWIFLNETFGQMMSNFGNSFEMKFYKLLNFVEKLIKSNKIGSDCIRKIIEIQTQIRNLLLKRSSCMAFLHCWKPAMYNTVLTECFNLK